MNVSAPTSVPDLAGLMLLLAAPPDMPAPSPGFAPSRLPAAGAETIPSFQSALADLLPAPADPQREPDPAEAKTLITGVVLSTPVPVVENLPLHFSVPPPFPDSNRESAPAQIRVGAALPETVPVSVPAAAPAAMPAFVSASVPAAAPDLRPAITIPAGPVDTTDAPTLPQPRTAAWAEAPAATRAPENASELENLAFVERFMPVPVETAANPPHSVPSIRPVNSTAATPPPAPSKPYSDGPESKPDFAQPAAEPAAKPQPAEPAPPAATNAPIAPPARASQSNHDMERRRQNEPPPQGATGLAPALAGHTEIRTEALQSVAPAAPAPPQAREIAAAEPRPSETRVPDPEPIAPSPAPQSHPAEARTLSLRLNDAGEQRVELKITERQGEVHVTVRAADADLAGSLRENLGELVHRLEQTGLRAETWQPAQSATASGNNMDRPADREFTGGQHSAQQQQQHPRDGRQGRQQDSQQVRWAEELENSFAADAERKIWFPA